MTSLAAHPYSLEPRAILAGAVPPGVEREVTAAGFQVAGRCALADVEAHGGPPRSDLVLLAFDGPVEEAVWDAIDACLEHDVATALWFGADRLEEIGGRLAGSRAILLCDPSPGEIAGALTLQRLTPSDRLNDSADVGESLRLQLLADQVSRIARALSDMTGNAPSLGRRGGLRSPTDDYADAAAGQSPVTAKAVRAVIAERRLRERFFDPDLFGEPAWDMLLDLYAARLEHTRVSVSSLCIAATVPSTTALRWLRTLTEEGLVRRRADPQDRRRVFIELVETTATGMDRYFIALAAPA